MFGVRNRSAVGQSGDFLNEVDVFLKRSKIGSQLVLMVNIKSYTTFLIGAQYHNR